MDYNSLPYTGAEPMGVDLYAWLIVAIVILAAGVAIRWAVTRG